MKFYLHKFKLLEILLLNSVKLEIFVSRFWTISLLQIIKDTSGRASPLLSYKLTPAKINILHMCSLHLFPVVPDRETSPIYWLSPSKMI